MPALVKLAGDWRPVGSGTLITPGGETPPTAPTGVLTLHFSEADLDEMRSRVNDGPFHTVGNGATWGDWTRIVGDKDRFMSTPTASRWDGPTENNPGGPVLTSSDPLNNTSGTGYRPPVDPSADIRNAAFYAWVRPEAGDAAAVATQVATILIQQVNWVDTVFADRSRWSTTTGDKSDNLPGAFIGVWAAKMLASYDFLTAYEAENSVSLFTSGQRTSLQAWHEALAEWILSMDEAQYEGANGNDPMYANRAIYAVSGSADDLLAHSLHRYKDASGQASRPPKIGIRYNNRAACSAHYMGMVGVRFNHATYKAAGIRWVKEYIRFGAYPDGTVSDFERGSSANPLTGWKYSCETVAPALYIAHALWNYDGDAQLFTESTSTGIGDTVGGPKSMKTMVKGLLDHVTNTYTRFGYNGTVGNAEHRIKPGTPTGDKHYNDIMVGPVMDHYLVATADGDANTFRDIYMRYAAGANAQPSPPASSQGDVRGGAWEHHPGVLFCFGRL